MHLPYFPWLCTLPTNIFLDGTVRYPFFPYIFCVFSHICPQAFFAASNVVFYLLIINKFKCIQLSTLETKTSIRRLVGACLLFVGGWPGEQARHRVRWLIFEDGGSWWGTVGGQSSSSGVG
jgi:hypothetical protein